MKTYKNLIFSICCLVYTAAYLLRLNLAVATPEIARQGFLTVAQVSFMGGLFFLCYACGQLANGYIGDRINPKWMIVTGIFVSGATNLAIGLLFLRNAVNGAVFVFWAVNGYAQSMLWGPIMRIASHSYQDKSRERAALILSVSSAFGSVAAYAVPAFILKIGVWGVFVFPAGVFAVLGTAVLIFLPNIFVRQDKKRNPGILSLVKNKHIAWNAAPALAHGVVKDNLLLWLPFIFASMRGGVQDSVLFLILAPLMMAAGRLIYPFVYRLSGRNENRVSAYCFLLCALTLIPLAVFQMPVIAIAAILSVCAAFMAAVNTSMLVILPLRFKETDNVSLSAGVMDFITYAGAGISAFVLGRFMDSENGFRVMTLVWIGCCAASVIVYFAKALVRNDVKNI